MNRKNGILVFIFALTLPLFSAEKESFPVRKWTSVSGDQIEGSFVREEEGKVFLRRPNGKLISTRRARLSPNDLAWIASVTAPKQEGGAAQVLSFERATKPQLHKMTHYHQIKRIIIRTYTKQTNNYRDDKMLAFLVQDATKIWGWMAVMADCYPLPDGRKGKVKRMAFLVANEIPLREAVQMTQDKFQLRMPYPITVKRVMVEGEPYWEVQNQPSYISRILLKETEVKGPDSSATVDQFIFQFPPPEGGR